MSVEYFLLRKENAQEKLERMKLFPCPAGRQKHPCKNRALTVQTTIFRGYITKKDAKSYDLTFKILCTFRDSNPGPTD